VYAPFNAIQFAVDGSVEKVVAASVTAWDNALQSSSFFAESFLHANEDAIHNAATMIRLKNGFLIIEIGFDLEYSVLMMAKIKFLNYRSQDAALKQFLLSEN